jgi:two-component system, response regulator PdtaR
VVTNSGYIKCGEVLTVAHEKILIVEDEGVVALHIRKTLESLGYVVTDTAATGEDAIMKAMKNRPDLVLMDIMLKGAIDGIDATEKIRPLFNIPVIYVTAHTDESTLQRAKVTEPFGYIVKPIKERDLYISIEFALYKFRMEAERKLLTQQLRDALAKVRTLSGLIPICASCKKIRDDKGFWEQLEHYISSHSDATFTHGLCPECALKMDPGFEDRK